MAEYIQKPTNKPNDTKILAGIILGFIFFLWLFTPPGNKFMQMLFLGNNAKFFWAKLTNSADVKEYMYHRNNAVYIAKMYGSKRAAKAIPEMDKAIELAPSFLPENELKELYRDRADIKLFAGDKNGALSDYLKAGDVGFNHYMNVGLLLADKGQIELAAKECNKILTIEYTAFAGYACMAYVYEKAGKPKAALSLYDLALDRKSNNPKAYLERAKIKRILKDEKGAEADIAKAKELSPYTDINSSIINETLNPKALMLKAK